MESHHKYLHLAHEVLNSPALPSPWTSNSYPQRFEIGLEKVWEDLESVAHIILCIRGGSVHNKRNTKYEKKKYEKWKK